MQGIIVYADCNHSYYCHRKNAWFDLNKNDIQKACLE